MDIDPAAASIKNFHLSLLRGHGRRTNATKSLLCVLTPRGGQQWEVPGRFSGQTNARAVYAPRRPDLQHTVTAERIRQLTHIFIGGGEASASWKLTPELSGCPRTAFNFNRRKIDEKHSIGQSARMTCYVLRSEKSNPFGESFFFIWHSQSYEPTRHPFSVNVLETNSSRFLFLSFFLLQ